LFLVVWDKRSRTPSKNRYFASARPAACTFSGAGALAAAQAEIAASPDKVFLSFVFLRALRGESSWSSAAPENNHKIYTIQPESASKNALILQILTKNRPNAPFFGIVFWGGKFRPLPLPPAPAASPLQKPLKMPITCC